MNANVVDIVDVRAEAARLKELFPARPKGAAGAGSVFPVDAQPAFGCPRPACNAPTRTPWNESAWAAKGSWAEAPTSAGCALGLIAWWSSLHRFTTF